MALSVVDAQKRLLRIAKLLDKGEALPCEDRIFISEALVKISQGEDAKTALNVKAKRGERVSKLSQDNARISDARKIMAMSWVAVATLPFEDGGLGLSNEEAIGRIGEFSTLFEDEKAFGLTEETLLTYWAKNPMLRKIIFKIPD